MHYAFHVKHTARGTRQMTKQTKPISDKTIERSIIAAKIIAIGNLILAIISPVFFFAG